MMDENGNVISRKESTISSKTSSRMRIKSHPSSRSRIPIKLDTKNKPVRHRPRSRCVSSTREVIPETEKVEVMKHPVSFTSAPSLKHSDSIIPDSCDENDYANHESVGQARQKYAVAMPNTCAANFHSHRVPNKQSARSTSAEKRCQQIMKRQRNENDEDCMQTQTGQRERCIPPTGVIVPKKNYPVCPRPRQLSCGTYENIFHRRKSISGRRGYVLSAAAPSAKTNHCNNNRRKNGAYADEAHFRAQQEALYTKIVTETNYEEYEEEVSSAGVGRNRRKKSKESSKQKVSVGNKTCQPKVQKVTIVEQPTTTKMISPSMSTSSLKKKTTSHISRRDRHKKKGNRSGRDGVKVTRKSSTEDSCCMSLHSELSEISNFQVESHVGESSESRTETCQTCNVYKNLLSQSDATIRYLTQMLVIKDNEIERHEKTGQSSPPPWRNWLNDDENGTFTSSEHPRAPIHCATVPIPIPKFDLDEFIRKYFKNALFTKDLQDSPFTPLQLFHVAISARDCMAQVVKEKLRHAEGILKQKYDGLVNLKSSSTKPLDDSVYFAVLDSYRRFVRFIYFYFKESLKRMENFEQTYISQPRNSTASMNEPTSRMVYSKEQVVTIDGERYTAVVIPIRKIGPEGDAFNGVTRAV